MAFLEQELEHFVERLPCPCCLTEGNEWHISIYWTMVLIAKYTPAAALRPSLPLTQPAGPKLGNPPEPSRVEIKSSET